MKAYYSDHFVLPLPPGHRFPMEKYSLLRSRLIASDLILEGDICVPEAASDEQLLSVHQVSYLERVKNGTLSEKEIRRIGFPWSPKLVERSRRSVGGTIAACRTALEQGISANLAGGTHHAYADHGEGFCVFNDVAVAARTIQEEGGAERVLIIDCDVHQGNGTAAIFARDESVFTFSIHGAKNFPFHKETSNLDIALPDGTGDEEYLKAFEKTLEQALHRSRVNTGSTNPGLVIYLAGADPFHDDRLGRLALSKSGLVERDKMALETCRAAGLPVAVVLSGGYAKDINDTVDIHYQTIQLAVQNFNHQHGVIQDDSLL